MPEYVIEMFKENDTELRVVQELVRCKDCAYWDETDSEIVCGEEIRPCRLCICPEMHTGEWFCKGGKRRK